MKYCIRFMLVSCFFILFYGCKGSGEKYYKEFQELYIRNDSTFTIEAYELLKKSAELGYVEAQYSLGNYFHSEEDNESLAKMWWRKAAEQEHSESQYLMYEYYYDEDNDSLAVYWLKRAAENNLSKAQYDLSDYYDDEDNDSLSVYWLKRAVDNENLDAIEDLADYYNDQDSIGKMLDLYDKGIALGSARMYYLKARFYIQMDKRKESVTCLKEAVQKNDPSAIQLLGDCYYYGYGIEQDYEKAFNLYSQVEYRKESALRLAKCYYRGYGTSINTTKAFGLFKKLAGNQAYWQLSKDDTAEAQYYLGECFYYGKGVSMNSDSTYYWWKKAADGGYGYAKERLNQIFE